MQVGQRISFLCALCGAFVGGCCVKFLKKTVRSILPKWTIMRSGSVTLLLQQRNVMLVMLVFCLPDFCRPFLCLAVFHIGETILIFSFKYKSYIYECLLRHWIKAVLYRRSKVHLWVWLDSYCPARLHRFGGDSICARILPTKWLGVTVLFWWLWILLTRRGFQKFSFCRDYHWHKLVCILIQFHLFWKVL